MSVIKKAPRPRSVDDKENATHKPEAGTKQAPRTEAARKTVQGEAGADGCLQGCQRPGPL